MRAASQIKVSMSLESEAEPARFPLCLLETHEFNAVLILPYQIDVDGWQSYIHAADTDTPCFARQYSAAAPMLLL